MTSIKYIHVFKNVEKYFKLKKMNSRTKLILIVAACALTWVIFALNWSTNELEFDSFPSNISVIQLKQLGSKYNQSKFEPNATHNRYQDRMSNRKMSLSRLTNDITVVTAFINIGKFQKGEGHTYFTPQLYKKWMKIFKRIQNPLIVYLEQTSDIALVKFLRKDFPANMTNIVQVRKNETWAFSLRPRIGDIYSQKSYPKHHPNTVVPDYSCTMHAKYEFMSQSVAENPFGTKYFCWLDIGLFRSETVAMDKTSKFYMGLPPNFEENKVAYGQVNFRNENQQAKKIFHSNFVWVCGCFFIANADVMARWTTTYMKAVEYYLSQGLMNTDQQVLYAMFNDKKSDIEIQAYRGDRRYNVWFSLGYVSREQGTKRISA